MSDVALLERLMSRVSIKNKGLHNELNSLKKAMLEGKVAVDEVVVEFWRLLFRSSWTEGGVGAAEVNILEKLISHGLITSSTTLDVEDVEDGSVREVIHLLAESLQLTERLSIKADMELEAIKLFLSASTTSKCRLDWQHIQGVLEALMALMARSRNAVNRSAAKGAVNQIVHDRMASTDAVEMMKWVSQLHPVTAEQSAMLIDVLCGVDGRWSEHIDAITRFLLNCCAFTERCVFEGLLKVATLALDRLPETGEMMELLAHRLLFSRQYQKDDDKPWPLQVQANRELLVQFYTTHLAHSGQRLMDIYLNVDGNERLDLVLEPLIQLICKYAQKQEIDRPGRSPSHEEAMNKFALQCQSAVLISIGSLLKWSKNATDSKVGLESVLRSKDVRQEVIVMFNRKPKLGLELAVSHGLLKTECPQSTARFLMNARGLSKATLGEFLAGEHETELLDAFIGLCEFQQKPFVQALRELLQLFRLPGEAQKIERVVEAFARAYIRNQNGEEEEQSETLIFQLAFMSVMLNTDLHSPQVRDKMSLAQFISNCKGLEGGDAIPEARLKAIYEDIASTEIKLAESYTVSPLPVGSRGTFAWYSAEPKDVARWFLRRNQMSLADAIVYGLINCGPPSSSKDLSSSVEVLETCRYEEILGIVEEMLKLFIVSGDSQMIEHFYARILGHLDEHQVNFPIGLTWLHDFITQRGNQLGDLWTVTLSTLARFDLASAVDAQHNLRTIDLNGLEGPALLSFLQALLAVPMDRPNYNAFLKHYALKLENLAPHTFERLLQASYMQEDYTGPGIFELLQRAFACVPLRNCAFFLANRVCQEQMPLLAAAGIRALAELTQALIAFGLDSDPTIADNAIGLFRFVSDLVYTAHVKDRGGHVSREDFLLRWNPVLSGLGHVAIQQDNVVISGNAIKMAFEIVRQQGVVYGPEQWRRVFRTLFLPIIEDLSLQRGRLAAELAITSLNWIVEIISDYAATLLQDPEINALQHVLLWIEGMVEKASEHLARNALIAFNMLLSRNHGQLSAAHWDQVLATLNRLIEFTLPDELLLFEPGPIDDGPESPPGSRRPSSVSSPRLLLTGLHAAFSSTSVGTSPVPPRPDFQSARYKCALQLLVLHSVKDMLLNGILPDASQEPTSSALNLSHIDGILKLAERSASFAESFNKNVELRTVLWKAGFLDAFENILLAKQEAAASLLIVLVTLQIYTNQDYRRDPLFQAVVEERLRNTTNAVLSLYTGLISDDPAMASIRRSLKAWPAVVTPLMTGLCRILGSEDASIRIPWISEPFELILEIYRLDKDKPQEAAHALLKSLCTKYMV